MVRIQVGVAAIAAASLLAAGLSSPAAAQDARLVRLATGSPAGVYFPVGVSLCRLVNETRPTHGIRCAAQPSAGSIANIETLQAGDVDLAIVQSDTQADAYAATGEAAFAELRAVMSLHPEPVTIVARSDAGIADLAGLAGSRVSAGPAGSGQREMWDMMMSAQGWTADDFDEVLDLSSTDQAEALCEGRIDAFVTTIGHPALTVQEATLSCEAVIVPAESPAIDSLVAASPELAHTTIPGGLYRGNDADIASFGVSATVVTRADVDDGVVYTFVTSALGNLERLRGFDPALGRLQRSEMQTRGLTAPLHPGASAAFGAAETPPGN